MVLRRQDWRMGSPIRRLGREADLNALSATAQSQTFTGVNLGVAFPITGKTNIVIVSIGDGGNGGPTTRVGGGGGGYAKTNATSTNGPYAIWTGSAANPHGNLGNGVFDSTSTGLCFAASGVSGDLGGIAGGGYYGNVVSYDGGQSGGAGVTGGGGGGGAATIISAGANGSPGSGATGGAGGLNGSGGTSGGAGGNNGAAGTNGTGQGAGGGAAGTGGSPQGAGQPGSVVITWIG
jgi:hypothetical protein